MTVAKSAYTNAKGGSRFNRASGVNARTQELLLNKHNVVRDKGAIT